MMMMNSSQEKTAQNANALYVTYRQRASSQVEQSSSPGPIARAALLWCGVSRLPCPGQLSPPQWRDSPTGAETITNVGRCLT